MLKNPKHVFWQALVLAVFVFFIGVYIGYLIESYRNSRISDLYVNAEQELLDIKAQSDIISAESISLSCEKAIENNINFGDRIYSEANVLKEYESSSRLSDAIKSEHRKYDLLRTLFWVNSIQLKKRCNSTFHTIVYLYDYNNPRLDINARQEVFSRLLGEVKANAGNSVMLIPIAGDNLLYSLALLMDTFNVTEQELPVILIDEKIKITELASKEDIEKYLS